MAKGEVVGRGRTAEVLAWGEGQGLAKNVPSAECQHLLRLLAQARCFVKIVYDLLSP